ncbi:ral guanine nucleotide dissociation stimulator-like isoform X2 [Equus caballus]|uniref:ral guanine nucleotide dissociation stimulator-like isoform X2 n=1 Tax=Equus caballus TaxID=9796 RepID=UPI0038B3C20E
MCSCIPSLRGSGAQRANNDSLLQRCRHWLRPHLQDLRPFGRRNPQSSTQEMVQELAHGSYGSISLDRGQVQQTTDLARGWTEGRRGESLGQRNEACRMRALQAGLLERLPPSIGPALAPRNMANVTTIVFDCAAVLTSHGVLDHLLATMRLASLRVIWPGSHLGGPAYLPQVQLQHLGPRRAELEAPVPELLPALEPEQGPAPGPEAAPAVVPPSAPELEAASPPAASPPAASPPSASPGPERAPSASAPVPASELEQDAPLTFGRSLPPAAEVTAEASAELREERPKLLDFPPKLVAEQLTRMDAELFKKVEPRHCLGFVWCQRPNGSKEYLAPTVRATINQFLHVSGCVITTCLGDLSMTAQDRARVVELWIQVAKECRVLGNYASLRAIVSALQSPSISRLQKTWGRVARKSSRKLKRFIKDQWVSRRQLVKEATSMLTSLETGPTGAQKGLIPFLGTFLNYLLLLDTNMEDYLEGNEINFEKRSEVSSCGLPVRRVGLWQSETPPGKTFSGPMPWALLFLGEFGTQSWERRPIGAWGKGLAPRTPSCRRSYFKPTVRTSKSCTELEGRRVPMWAKTPDQLLDPLLTCLSPQHGPPPRPRLHHVLSPRNSKSLSRSSCSRRQSIFTTLRLRSDLGPGSRPWSPSARMRATACPATWSPHRRGPARCAGFSCPRRTARLSAQGSSPDP